MKVVRHFFNLIFNFKMRNHWHHNSAGWKAEFVRCCHCMAIWSEVYPANSVGLQCPCCKQVTGIRIFKGFKDDRCRATTKK